METAQRTDPRRDEAGFTLVEAMCAIVILVFGLMAITNLMLVAATSNTVANHSTAATALATQQMEALKATSFELLAAGGDIENDVAGYFVDPVPEVPGVGQIRVRWQMTQVDVRTLYIQVRAESLAPLAGTRSRAEFTAIRTCQNQAQGCP
jgi:type II secretory pathway pseudopilin PulG